MRSNYQFARGSIDYNFVFAVSFSNGSITQYTSVSQWCYIQWHHNGVDADVWRHPKVIHKETIRWVQIYSIIYMCLLCVCVCVCVCVFVFVCVCVCVPDKYLDARGYVCRFIYYILPTDFIFYR